MAAMNLRRDMYALRRDTDRDGVPDWRDQDDDNDGVLDRYDRTPKGRRLNMKRGKRAGSTKIVKPSRGFSQVILSFAGGRLLSRKNDTPQAPGTVAAAIVPPSSGLRSVVSEQRGYARGPLTVRGQGRDTGVTKLGSPSSRADLVKRSAPARFTQHGASRKPGDSI